MNIIRLFWAAALLACGVAQAGDSVVLGPGTTDPRWRALIGALSQKGSIRSSFTELRHFPFRREPTVLDGTLRFSPRLGLSLQYTRPEGTVMIADSRGLEVRDAAGLSHDMPAESDAASAIESILPIMRFDMAALYRAFNVQGEMTDGNWTFEFTPKDADLAEAFGSILVAGSGTDVKRLDFRRAGSMRVEIEVRDTRTGVSFTPDELARFFR